MDFDNGWDALLKPGQATSYFDLHSGRSFDVGATSYSPIDAWWLAEISRLIYRQGKDEVTNAKGPTRDDVLKSVGLEEEIFIPTKLAQCAIVNRPGSSGALFKVLVFRGTHDLIDWISDLDALPIRSKGRGLVHQGFEKALESVWKKVEPRLNAATCPVFYTGHSLGAALATLAASRRAPSALYTFGSPRVGDDGFIRSLSQTAVYRVVNNRDAVPTVPPALDYCHIGEIHYITHDGRMLVDPSNDEIAADRLQRDHKSLSIRDWHKHFTDAPEYLADHAPVNYVAHLERMFS